MAYGRWDANDVQATCWETKSAEDNSVGKDSWEDWAFIEKDYESSCPGDSGGWSDRTSDHCPPYSPRQSRDNRSSNNHSVMYPFSRDLTENNAPQSPRGRSSERSISLHKRQYDLWRDVCSMTLDSEATENLADLGSLEIRMCCDPYFDDKVIVLQDAFQGHRSCCISSAALRLSTQEMSSGTCQWLLGSDEFHEWLTEPVGVFWLTGIPGTGKSVLTSMVVRQLESSRRPRDILVFYFADGYYKEIDATTGILKAILQQMLQHGLIDVNLWDQFTDFLAHGDRLTKSTVMYFLNKIIHKLDPQQTLYLVLDGLDDLKPSPEERELLFDLVDIASHHDSRHKMKCFISSHSKFFAGHHWPSGLRVDLDSQPYTRNDMVQYVHGKLLNGPMPVQSRAADDISHAILGSTFTSFLYLRLLGDMNFQPLHSGLRDEKLLIPETFLPTDIEMIYGHMLSQIDQANHKAATSMFCWVTYVVRPLDSNELLDALEHETGIRLNEDEICSISAGLLSKHGQQIRFAHLSVREFLQSNLNPAWADRGYVVDETIAAACLRVLSSFELLQSLCLEEYTQLEQPSHTPTRRSNILPYARAHWIFHYKRAERKSGFLAGMLHEQLKQSLLRQAANLPLDYIGEDLSLDTSRQDVSRPRPFNLQRVALHCGSRFGFWNLSKLELDMGANPNVLSGPEKRNPLHWAARTGNLDMVHLLLQYGAKINTLSGSGKTALVYAMLNGHLDLVDSLQERSPIDSKPSSDTWNLTSLSDEYATQQLRLDKFFSDSCIACDEVETSYLLSAVLSLNSEEDHFPSIYISGESFPRSRFSKPRSQCVSSTSVMWFSGSRMFHVLDRAAKRGIEHVKRLLIAAGNDGAAIENSLNYVPG